MRPDKRVTHDYLAAFAEIVGRIAQSLTGAPAGALPVRMYVAGGAALQIHIGARVSEDIDATFSRRLVLSDDLSATEQTRSVALRMLFISPETERNR